MKYWIGMVLVCTVVPSCLAFGQRVRLPEGTAVRVCLKADLTSDQAAVVARVDFEVTRPVVIQGMTVIPQGAVAWGAVQSVKIGKFIEFDIEGVQLADGTNVKLRSVGVRAKKPWQNRLKVDSSFKGGVGAPKGTEYTAYVDEGIEVEVSGQPTGAPALAAAPSAAPSTPAPQAVTPPPTPAPTVTPNASTVTPGATSTTPTAPPPAATPEPPAVTTAAAHPAATAVEAPPVITPAATAAPAVATPAAATPAVATPAITTPAPTAPPLAASSTQPPALPANVERVRVECFSDPSGAEILIDGEFYGNTPSILKLPVGRHEMEIQLSGYRTYAIPLILQSGAGMRTIRAPLEQKE